MKQYFGNFSDLSVLQQTKQKVSLKKMLLGGYFFLFRKDFVLKDILLTLRQKVSQKVPLCVWLRPIIYSSDVAEAEELYKFRSWTLLSFCTLLFVGAAFQP